MILQPLLLRTSLPATCSIREWKLYIQNLFIRVYQTVKNDTWFKNLVSAIIRENHNDINGKVYWGGDLSFKVKTLWIHKMTAVPYKGSSVKTCIVTVKIGQTAIIEFQMEEISLFSFVVVKLTWPTWTAMLDVNFVSSYAEVPLQYKG